MSKTTTITTGTTGRLSKVQPPAEVFGVTFSPGPLHPLRHWRDAHPTPIKDFIYGVLGVTARRDNERLTKRVHELERVVEALMRALDENFLAEMEVTLEPVETQLQALRQTQIESGVVLRDALENSRQTTTRLIAVVDALRVDLGREMARLEGRLEQEIAALPPQWREDFNRTIEELRNSPDGANALLHGAESLAGSVARRIGDFDQEGPS